MYILIGHSLGSKLASQVGANSKEIINLNQAVSPADAFIKVKPNEYNIGTRNDLVSTLLPLRNDPLTIDSPLTAEKGHEDIVEMLIQLR
jgi:hypothetical protein